METKDIQKKEAQSPNGSERTRNHKVYTPSVDIIERKEELVLVADMPGVDENSVDVTLEKNMLNIYGKVDFDIPEHNKVVLAEYGVGDYSRSFTLSNEIDRDRIQATVKNGVLSLVLPKAETAKTKRIAIAAG